ncbi:MAG: hypothetical protein ACRYG8_37120, partial [Janthinobacterium lividum]
SPGPAGGSPQATTTQAGEKRCAMSTRKGLSLGSGVAVAGIWTGLGMAMQAGHYPCLFIALGAAFTVAVLCS